ncbi:unnamed protein product [Clonostachys rosea f. rosea IK726]|uniref:Uncharacterized protein n=1 Tax=Clonostachys rosea f. rosea IK726 TaxID=1349383 RepID=A0ACA9UJE2_BIOOC|nr:unnamed protein product [Clonostachys rosea f. rosea IK726]
MPIAGLASSVNPGSYLRLGYIVRYTNQRQSILAQLLSRECLRLEDSLKRLGLITKRYPDSLVVTFERPPSWIIEEFSLRPEGDWVHVITMPHVSAETIEVFLDRMESVTKACSAALVASRPSSATH